MRMTIYGLWTNRFQWARPRTADSLLLQFIFCFLLVGLVEKADAADSYSQRFQRGAANSRGTPQSNRASTRTATTANQNFTRSANQGSNGPIAPKVANLLHLQYGKSVNDLREELKAGNLNIDAKNNPVRRTDKDLSWPRLPRAIFESGKEQLNTGNTYFGFKMNPGLFGMNVSTAAKLSFDVVLKTKSSIMILYSTNDYTEGPPEKNRIQLTSNLDSIHDAGRINLHRDFPVVGTCVHEVVFSLGTSQQATLEVAGSGASTNFSNSEFVSKTYLSKFFRLKRKKGDENKLIGKSEFTDTEYQSWCAQTFEKEIDQRLATDFYPKVIRMVYFKNPKSTCTPRTNSKLDPKGDLSCQKWFQGIDPGIREKTLPRCELTAQATHRCVLKAKKAGLSCPLFMSRKGKVTDFYPGPKKGYKRITERDIEVARHHLPCDRGAGLVCQMEKEPWFLGPVQMSQAKGVCRKSTDQNYRKYLRN